MSDDDDKTIKKASLRFPIGLHRWFRHRAVDHDATFEDTIMAVLEEWAKQHGYDPDAPRPEGRPDPS